MSGLFGSVTIKGNRITEFAAQTGAVGIPIPFGYGVIIVDGNVIWVSKVTTHVTKKKQGKGGIKTEEYTYTRSYAIGFCQGPIFDYYIITRNGKAVYVLGKDLSESDTEGRLALIARLVRQTVEELQNKGVVFDIEYARKWMEKAALYYGTRDQMPDSTIEAIEGAGNVSAHRDLAYLVMEDDDVTDTSGAVPSYQAIIIATPPQVFMTSRPYAIESDDGLTIAAGVNKVSPWTNPPDENATISATVFGGDLFGGGIVYDDWPAEFATIAGAVLGGDIFGSGVVYEDWPDESATIAGAVLGGDLFGTGVVYELWPEESMNITAEVLGGDLI